MKNRDKDNINNHNEEHKNNRNHSQNTSNHHDNEKADAAFDEAIQNAFKNHQIFGSADDGWDDLAADLDRAEAKSQAVSYRKSQWLAAASLLLFIGYGLYVLQNYTTPYVVDQVAQNTVISEQARTKNTIQQESVNTNFDNLKNKEELNHSNNATNPKTDNTLLALAKMEATKPVLLKEKNTKNKSQLTNNQAFTKNKKTVNSNHQSKNKNELTSTKKSTTTATTTEDNQDKAIKIIAPLSLTAPITSQKQPASPKQQPATDKATSTLLYKGLSPEKRKKLSTKAASNTNERRQQQSSLKGSSTVPDAVLFKPQNKVKNNTSPNPLPNTRYPKTTSKPVPPINNFRPQNLNIAALNPSQNTQISVTHTEPTAAEKINTKATQGIDNQSLVQNTPARPTLSPKSNPIVNPNPKNKEQQAIAKNQLSPQLKAQPNRQFIATNTSPNPTLPNKIATNPTHQALLQETIIDEDEKLTENDPKSTNKLRNLLAEDPYQTPKLKRYKTAKKDIRVGIHTAANANFMDIQDPKSIGNTTGISIEKKTNKNWAIEIGAYYSQKQFTHQYKAAEAFTAETFAAATDNSITYKDATIVDLQAIEVPVLVKYQPKVRRRQKFQPYISAGLSAYISLSDSRTQNNSRHVKTNAIVQVTDLSPNTDIGIADDESFNDGSSDTGLTPFNPSPEFPQESTSTNVMSEYQYQSTQRNQVNFYTDIANIRGGFDYKLSDKINLRLESQFKTSLSKHSFSNQSTDKKRLNSLGLQIGITCSL